MSENQSFLLRREIYEYYKSGGLSHYIMRKITKILIGTSLAFSPIIIFGCIDFCNYTKADHLSDIFFSFSDGWKNSCVFCKLCTTVFLIYNLFYLIQFLFSLRLFTRMHTYFNTSLGISDREIGTTKWNEIVESVSVQDSSQPVAMLTIAQAILRTDNYICSLISDSSLLTWRLPTMNNVTHFPKSRLFFTFFKLALVGTVFDQNGSSMVSGTATTMHTISKAQTSLLLRFRLIGLLLLIFSPFVFAFELLYIVLKLCTFSNSEKSGSARLMTPPFREWTFEAKWAIREYNELPHFFKKRLAKSYKYANDYLDQFPLVFVKPIATIVSFACGAILIILGVISFATDVNIVLSAKVFAGKSVAWFAILLIFIYLISTKIASQKDPSIGADEAMAELEKYVHYDFRDESNSVHSIETQKRLSHFFQPICYQFFLELFSVFLNPFLFGILLPLKFVSIVDFVKTNSVQNPELGWICAFSAFDMNDRGFNGAANQRDKVMRSIRNFEDNDEQNNGNQNLIGLRQDFTNSELAESIIHEGTLLPRASSPLIRTDFGSSNEALDSMGNYSPTDFFAYPAEFEQEL